MANFKLVFAGGSPGDAFVDLIYIDNGDGTFSPSVNPAADGTYPSKASAIAAGTPLRLSGTVAFFANTVTKTGTYIALSTDYTIRCDATAGAFSVTLPAAASVKGQVLNVKKIDATNNAVTLTGNGAETIDGTNTKALTTQYQSFQVQSNGTGWDVI